MVLENQIINKYNLTKEIVSFEVFSPTIANKAKAGQFVIVRASSNGERIPLTIADFNSTRGYINLTILKRGKSTNQLGLMEPGQLLNDIVGPLGKPSEIEKFGNVVVIGGGVGIAPILPIIKSLHYEDNYIISVLGAKSAEGLIFTKEIKQYSNEFHICTDDGSLGFKGFVSEFLLNYLKKDNKKINRVIAIGPALMMKAVCSITKNFNIKTIVSLNPIMVDGTGMCGSCRVEVANQTKFACVDGPEFDGHQVDFDLLISRLNIYCNEEDIALKKFMENHKCKMNI